MTDKITIGRKDRADFPELKLEDIDIKIDTGAYTSSIHCHHIEVIELDGVSTLRFMLLDPSHPLYHNKVLSTANYWQKEVKNSFGNSEMRYFISTIITLFGKDWPIDLSLSERAEMKFPVLIGRKLLNKKFIVDTQRTNLSFKLKRKSLSN